VGRGARPRIARRSGCGVESPKKDCFWDATALCHSASGIRYLYWAAAWQQAASVRTSETVWSRFSYICFHTALFESSCIWAYSIASTLGIDFLDFLLFFAMPAGAASALLDFDFADIGVAVGVCW